MAESLLAHLYTHIKGSQEDIATLSLQYILSQSDELNRAFNKLLSNSLKTNFDTSVHYLCQATGENKERPDLAGINNDGHEEILCEAKFYAGLTANQPLAYIDRLLNEEGKGLVFICPKDRIISLWSKLKTLCKDRSVEEIDEYCISVDGIHMTIVSWTEILNTLNKIAVTVAPKCLSDINQLEGYCSQMDSDAFIPFTEEDLGADIAIKGERYYQVVDQTIELLSADKNHKSSRKGLKARTNRDGYASSVIIDNIGITLLYDRYFWRSQSSMETPFWIIFRDSKWNQTEKILKKLRVYPEIKKDEAWGLLYLGLEPLTNACLDEVCIDLKNQIINILESINS